MINLKKYGNQYLLIQTNHHPPQIPLNSFEKKMGGVVFQLFFYSFFCAFWLGFVPTCHDIMVSSSQSKKGKWCFFVFFQWKWWCITPLQCDILWWWTWLASLEKESIHQQGRVVVYVSTHEETGLLANLFSKQRIMLYHHCILSGVDVGIFYEVE